MKIYLYFLTIFFLLTFISCDEIPDLKINYKPSEDFNSKIDSTSNAHIDSFKINMNERNLTNFFDKYAFNDQMRINLEKAKIYLESNFLEFKTFWSNKRRESFLELDFWDETRRLKCKYWFADKTGKYISADFEFFDPDVKNLIATTNGIESLFERNNIYKIKEMDTIKKYDFARMIIDTTYSMGFIQLYK